MTDVQVGVVDVFVIRHRGGDWRVLCLQRALNTRCPASWEMVTGRIEPGERPVDAAHREVLEETGLRIERLYHASVQPFYLTPSDVLQMAIVFCAFVADDEPAVVLSHEHAAYEWLPLADASARQSWPWARRLLRESYELLGTGDGGPVDDVVRAR